MDDVMKKQIQKAIEDVFLRQLRHKYSAYLGVTSRDILDHLMDRYGKIKPADYSLEESDEDVEAEEKRVIRTAK